jgi:hypothetical protein
MVPQESVRVIVVRMVDRIAHDQPPRSLPAPQWRLRHLRQRTGVELLEPRSVMPRGAPERCSGRNGQLRLSGGARISRTREHTGARTLPAVPSGQRLRAAVCYAYVGTRGAHPLHEASSNQSPDAA